MTLYHGSKKNVKIPEIRITQYNKDFYFGFYCTVMSEQAKRWAVRYTGNGMINEYEYEHTGNLPDLKSLHIIVNRLKK